MYKLNEVNLSNGETLAYRVAGTGHVKVLLLHGNQSSSLIYEDFMKRYEDVATVYAVDLTGFGESSYRKQHLKIEDWSDDIKEFMDEVHLDNAIVVGHSAGGGVGLKLAIDYPEKVRHLILIASVGVKGFYLPKMTSEFKPIEGKFAYTYEDIAEHPSMKFVQMTIKNEMKSNIRKMWNASLYDLSKPREEVYKSYMEEFLKERCFIDISVALVQFNITDEASQIRAEKGDGSIKKIKAPVTWFHGKKDKVVPYEIGQKSIKYFPNGADFITLENAGHMIFNDCPEEFYGHVDKIIGKYVDEDGKW